MAGDDGSLAAATVLGSPRLCKVNPQTESCSMQPSISKITLDLNRIAIWRGTVPGLVLHCCTLVFRSHMYTGYFR